MDENDFENDQELQEGEGYSDFIEATGPTGLVFPDLPESSLSHPLYNTGDPADGTLVGLVMTEAAAQVMGAIWPVVIIESCVSDNGNWYRGNILRESTSVFEGAPCRIYSFDGRTKRDGTISAIHNDHMPGWLAARDAGSVTGNTVGQFRNVHMRQIKSTRTPGRMVEAMCADLVFVDSPTRNRIMEAWNLGLMNPNGRSLFELSIEASGPHKTAFHESRQVRMVEGIRNVKEVTIVSEGAAGGRFMSPDARHVEASPDGLKTFLKSAEAEKTIADNSPFNEKLTDGNFSEFREGPLQRLGPAKTNAAQDSLPGGNYAADEELNKQSPVKDTLPPSDEMIPQFDEDDLSQARKAADVLRTGNLTLGVETIEGILEKHNKIKPDCPVQQVNQVMTPQRESKKEPKKMPKMQENLESEVPEGSDHSHYSEAVQADEMRDWVNLVAQRDRERDDTIADLMESNNQMAGLLEKTSEALLRMNESQAAAEQREAVRHCERILRIRLSESQLPDTQQLGIAEDFSGRIFKEGALIKRIDRERQTFIQLNESLRESYGAPGQVNGGSIYTGGFMQVSAGRNAFDMVAAEFDRAMGYNPAIDDSLSESEKQVYRDLPRTASLKRPMGIWHGDMEYNFDGQVGRTGLFREAASTDVGLAALLQNSMTKSVKQKFMLLPAQYREVAEIVPAANFLEHQVIVTGGLGLLPQVAESKTGNSYLNLGFPSNFQTKYNVNTYGGLIPVTRQAIINDNLQEIQDYPKRAAESAMMTLNLNVFGTLIGYYGLDSAGAAVSGTINAACSYDGVPWYHDNHYNTTSGAMSYSELILMQNRLMEQRTFGNATTLAADITIGDSTFVTTANKNDFITGIKPGDYIQIEAERVRVASVNTGTNTVTIVGTFAAGHTHSSNTRLVLQLSSPIAYDQRLLIVPTQLNALAFQLLASALLPEVTTNSVNALYPAYKSGNLSLLQLHSMYLQGDTNNYYMCAGKPIRWAFLGGRETPEVLLQDNPLVGQVFTGDLISWKVRHEHGGTMLDHLMVQAGLVTGL